METKVVLCCVKPKRGLEKQITHKSFESIFSKIGLVKNTKNFEAKLTVIKAFIEFHQIESAKLAVVEFREIETEFVSLRTYASKKTVVKSVPN